MRKMFSITVRELADLAQQPLPDSDLIIEGFSTVTHPQPNSMLFAKSPTESVLASLQGVYDALILIPENTAPDALQVIGAKNLVAPTKNPRLAFARLANAALGQREHQRDFEMRDGAIIAKGVRIPSSARIEPGAFIDHDVEIGDDVLILSGARIRAYTTIGGGTIIRENAVVGSQGFGFERDEAGVPVRLPHIGGVQIGRGVEIGAFSVVCGGTIEPTVVEDYVKIDNLVHIAHNCHIGRGTIVTACSEISGSVTIGESSWLGPNCCIIEGRLVGRRVTIGIGAVVIKDVRDDETVAGNPARTTQELSRVNAALKSILRDS